MDVNVSPIGLKATVRLKKYDPEILQDTRREHQTEAEEEGGIIPGAAPTQPAQRGTHSRKDPPLSVDSASCCLHFKDFPSRSSPVVCEV
jgi:hypothetical protein